MTSDGREVVDTLDTDNYGTWSRRMKAYLLSRELWDVTTGSDEDKKKSNKAMGLIQLHLSDFHLSMADEVATAKGLWDKLEETFKAKNTGRRLLLRQQLNSLKKGPTEPIAKYVARAKSIASDLEGAGHKPEASEITLPVLAGLPKEYSMLITVLGTSKEEHTLDDILTMLLQTEQQISRELETAEAAVPIYAMRDGRNGRSQPRNNQQRRGNPNKAKMKTECFYCGKPGHFKSRLSQARFRSAKEHSAHNSLWCLSRGGIQT